MMTRNYGNIKNTKLLSSFDFLVLPSAFFIVTCVAILLLYFNAECFKYFMENFRSTLRGSFFTGFLTLGSLLWAVKAFIIMNLKKDYFEKQLDDPKFILDMQTLYDANDKKFDFSIYFYPLVNLSRALFLSIYASLVTAIVQVTIGSLKNIYATVFSCSCIAFTFVLLAHTLYYVNVNYRSWMDDSTESYDEKIKSKLQ